MVAPNFWQQRWIDNQIGFHQDAINPYLTEYWPQDKGQRIIVPLCGKSLDLRFLSRFGEVTGVELSDIAIKDFFAEWAVAPTQTMRGDHKCTSGRGVDLLHGDFFDLPESLSSHFSHAFDRAAVIALPPEQHSAYFAQLSRLMAPEGFVLSVTVEYPQGEMKGPPFSVSAAHMQQIASPYFKVENIVSLDTWRPDSRLAQEGLTELTTHVFGLTKR